MFVPEAMREVNLFVFEQDLEPVAAAITALDILHLEDIQAKDWKPAPEWREFCEKYLDLAQRLEELLSALQVASRNGEPPADLNPRNDLAGLEAQAEVLQQKVRDWQTRRRDIRRKVERLELAVAQLRLLLPLKAPLAELRDLSHQHLVIGSLPSENLPRVSAALFQIAFALIPLSEQNDRTIVLASTSEEQADVLDRALKSAFFEPIELPPEAQGPPEEALPFLEQELRGCQAKREEFEEERRRLAGELGPQLLELRRRAQANLRLAEAIRRFPRRGEIYLIVGWVPASRLKEFHCRARDAARSRLVIEVLEPDTTRQNVPSLLANLAWLRPFRGLVTTFGISAYGELDPTLIATAAFVLMYGMMFGDIGHGAVLAAVGLALRKKSSALGAIAVAAGASGVVFGLLFGTAFGYQLVSPAWLRPMDEIRTLLLTAVLAGVALLNIGFGLNLINAWRSKEWPRFFLEKNGLLGIALYWTLLGGGVAVGLGLMRIGVWASAGLCLCLLMWFREPLAAKIWGGAVVPMGEVIVTGFFELFEAVIGYLSNSFSFIRLGAFAVAHEGISHMLLLYSGGPAGWLVFLAGTVLIVGFEGIIVGIQALRLEYYEFFGRFFQGTGQPFVPLSFKGGHDATVGVRA